MLDHTRSLLYLVLPMEHKKMPTPVELDATQLSYEEHFFLWAVKALKPDPKMVDVLEFQKRVMGMGDAEKNMAFRIGMESLIQKGAVVPVGVDTENKPQWELNLKVVTRVAHIDPTIKQ